jgi:predicted RNA methylase
MTNASNIAAARAAAPSHAPASTAVAQAARLLLPDLERGRRIDAAILRAAMESAFGASDASGAWDWKTAYDACEAATVLFLRKFSTAIRAKGTSPAAMLPLLTRIAGLLPTHTRRSEESQALQQFSTPIPLGLAACTAAAITTADRVLEPSAGTGLLAILAELAGGSLVLNELAEARASLLDQLFPGIAVTRFDAAQIDDHLDPAVVPSVVLMNPPFSALAHVDRRIAAATLHHVMSALARLCDGGRLVAITGASFTLDNPAWTEAFIRLQERGRVVFSAGIDGAVYAKHGTTTDTGLLVIDKQPAANPHVFPASLGMAADAGTLLAWVAQHVPPRLLLSAPVVVPTTRPILPRTVRACAMRPTSGTSLPAPEGVELAYETIDWTPPLPPRLVPRRRHRRGQRPPGRRHLARQLAQGPPPRALDQQIRQADRGRTARLVGARHGAAAGHAVVPLPPGHADQIGGGHPVYDLRHAAHR